MVLSHAKDTTAPYGATAQIKDCVLTVISFYTQHKRRTVLDTIYLAGLNTLVLIDETTAAGLHFGIDRIDEVANNLCSIIWEYQHSRLLLFNIILTIVKSQDLPKQKKLALFRSLVEHGILHYRSIF